MAERGSQQPAGPELNPGPFFKNMLLNLAIAVACGVLAR